MASVPSDTQTAVIAEEPAEIPSPVPTETVTSTPDPTDTPTETSISESTETPVPAEPEEIKEEVTEPVDELEARTEDLDKIMYAVSAVNVRAGDNTEYDRIGGLTWAQEVKVTGRSTDTQWFQIEFTDASTGDTLQGYVSNKYLSESKPKAQEKATPEEAAAAQSGQITQSAPASSGDNFGAHALGNNIAVSGNAADGAQYAGALADVNLH